MASLVKNKGKVGLPSFYGEASSTVKSKATAVKSKLPLFALLILAGVAIVFVLRNRSSSTTSTGTAVQVGVSSDDVSSIENLTQAINALQGQVYTADPTPTGGTSTPTTSVATGNVSTSAGNTAGTSYTNPIASAYTAVGQDTGGSGKTVYSGPETIVNKGVSTVQDASINNGYPTATYNGVAYTSDSKGAQGYVDWLKSVGPANYNGINSGTNDPAEYARNLAAGEKQVAMYKSVGK